ncbi:hypothetical protein [Kaistia granuli]|uniref:hypothetical protein n=1 Tax=Kaistia granuli TaxID=363259 RepID=UPI00039EFAC8|nr:hypothetical protein [Kaistia granuli]
MFAVADGDLRPDGLARLWLLRRFRLLQARAARSTGRLRRGLRQVMDQFHTKGMM